MLVQGTFSLSLARRTLVFRETYITTYLVFPCVGSGESLVMLVGFSPRLARRTLVLRESHVTTATYLVQSRTWGLRRVVRMQPCRCFVKVQSLSILDLSKTYQKQ